MNRYIVLIRNIVSKEAPKPLGRWNMENCRTKIKQKIDLSNEDHCGPCGQYALLKLDTEKKKTIQQKKSIQSSSM